MIEGDEPSSSGEPGSSDSFEADAQALSDRDQTAADAEQSESDLDQTASAADQGASEGDQLASDRAVIARFGGDEFVCPITDQHVPGAREPTKPCATHVTDPENANSERKTMNGPYTEPRRKSVRWLTPLQVFGFATLAAMLIATVAMAAAPAATTGAATAVTDTTATLEGTVSPNKEDTTYYFEYGTTTEYGAKTPTEGPVGGNADKAVKADVTGLSPSTTYHFRLVAANASGTTQGSDATFTTTAAGAPPAAQNTVTIAASPKAVTFGKPTAISGQVTGPDNAGVEVTLEENPHPYTGGFKPTAVKGTTSATGAYMLAVVPTVNTRYRVAAKTKPPVESAEVAVNVRVKVGLRVSDRTPAAGKRVRFSGKVTPGHDGKVVRIQRRTSTGSWRTVARATLVAATPLNGVTRSKFSKRLRINRNGTYRARLSPGDGDHAAGNSPRRRVRVH